MVPVLVDDWLYMDIDGQPGTYGREETQRNFMARMKLVVAAFIDCEVKVITTPLESGPQKEALINAAFGQGYLIQEERLSPQAVQIIAAKKDKIQDIYRYFQPVKIQSLVPYAVALRAFLKSRSLLPEEGIVVCVDDLKTQAVVTVMEGLRFAAPRRISMRDVNYMASEIKRSQQSYLAQRENSAATPLFFIVCNNREWLAAFMEQELAPRQNIAHLDAAFPVLEGLKNAKFGMHFTLPEELVRQKKKAIVRSRLQATLTAMLSMALALGFYSTAFFYKNDSAMRLRRVQSDQDRLLVRLRSLYPNKLKNLLKPARNLVFDRWYYDFIQSLPEDARLKEFNLARDTQGQWHLSALVYPTGEYARYPRFSVYGKFSTARISAAVTEKKLGQRIDMAIGQAQGGQI